MPDDFVTISARIPTRLHQRLERASAGQMAPNKTQIIVQGLTLVLSQIEEEKRKKDEAK